MTGLFSSGVFARNVDILHRAMDVNVLRRNVTANNIANADTPNFKRTFVNYEAQLSRALRSENRQRLPALLTDERHIPFSRAVDYRQVQPRRVLDYLSTSKNNGNNVDVEQEMVSAIENQLLYQTMSQAIASEFTRVNIVLR